MRVTKWGEYGILCSLYLATKVKEGPIGAQEISEAKSIPLQYTQQILQRLRKGGIIKSARGPNGGYSLCRTPEQTTLKDIFCAAEGDTFEVVCDTDPIYPDRCGQEPCGLHSVWNDLKASIDQLLASRSLAWVIEKELAEKQCVDNKLVNLPRTPSN